VRHFAVVLFGSFVVLVASCSSSSGSPQAQATAGQSAPTSAQVSAPTTATPTLAPTPAPTPQTFDACALLTREDVATLFGPPTPTQQLLPLTAFGFSGAPQVPAANGTSCNYTNIQSVPSGSPTGSQITFYVCRCNSSTADFDVWAKNPSVIGTLPQGTAPTLIASVGERAYLLPTALGIVFRQSGLDFFLRGTARLPEFRQPGSTPQPPFDQFPALPPLELDAKAASVYSGLAAKIIGRLASAPAAPTVLACSVGRPTVTPPAGVSYVSCDEQGGETAYRWFGSVNGVSINFQLNRRPFAFGTGEGVDVDVNGNVGKQYSRGGAHYVNWSDGKLTWRLSAQDTVGPDVALAFARSVRSELVAETPRPTAVAPSGGSTGPLCATTPSLTLPAGFTFLSCSEAGPSASFTWTASGRGSFTFTIVRPPSNFGPQTGAEVDVNGRPGTLVAQGTAGNVWLLVWSGVNLNYSIGASGMSREEVLAAARSVR
jgi:hypothetical protein